MPGTTCECVGMLTEADVSHGSFCMTSGMMDILVFAVFFVFFNHLNLRLGFPYFS